MKLQRHGRMILFAILIGPLCGPEHELSAGHGAHSGPRPAQRAEETLATSQGIRGLSRAKSLAGRLAGPGVPEARQQPDVELVGTVSNEAGEPLAAAPVTLTDASGRQLTAFSDATGGYAFRNVPPGKYRIGVTLQGYAPAARDMTLVAGRNGPVEFRLRLAITEQVEVVSSLADLRHATGLSPVGLLLGPDDLSALPTDPDLLLQVLRDLSATSGRADQVIVQVDGQPILGRLPPKDAIQSIRISTNSFASEFSEPSAGLVEIITRPASTSYRGDAQFTFNDEVLNAKNAFEPEEQPSQLRALSAYIGGPVIRGRWSFLVYGDRWERDDRVVVNAADPAAPGQRFVQSVPMPVRIGSYSLRTDASITTRHVASVEFAGLDEDARNQGLSSGLDLPERGINHMVRDQAGRASLVSAIGTSAGNELRVRLHRRDLVEAAVTSTPAILVLDAFNAGGNQGALALDRHLEEVSVREIFSYSTGPHAVRVGGIFDGGRVVETRQSNLGGTYVFGAVVDPSGAVLATPHDRYLRTIQGIAGYRPSYFAMARGAPTIDFTDWRLGWFAQDDWRVRSDLTLSLGLRHDLQKALSSQWNLAPRVGVAWTPAGNAAHTVRSAFGVFHDDVPFDVSLDTLRYSGFGVEELIVVAPGFFPAIPSAPTGQPALSTIRVQDALRAPRTLAFMSGYEWQMAKSIFGSISYTRLRGDRLLRTRNLNAADPATGARPSPAQGPVLQFETTGRSRVDQLAFTLRRALAQVSLFGTYVLRYANSDTDGPYTVAADAYTLQGEYGRAGDDERHHVVAGGLVSLPGDMTISGFVTYGSGRPFNITTGRDDDGDLVYADRPGMAAADDPSAIHTPFGNFDLSRGPGEPMILRNFGQGPRQFFVNVGVSKMIRSDIGPAGQRMGPYVVFTVSAENLTNRVNFVDFNGVVTSPFFGTANRALNARRIELAVRVGF
jgi:hypothetical protein